VGGEHALEARSIHRFAQCWIVAPRHHYAFRKGTCNHDLIQLCGLAARSIKETGGTIEIH